MTKLWESDFDGPSGNIWDAFPAQWQYRAGTLPIVNGVLETGAYGGHANWVGSGFRYNQFLKFSAQANGNGDPSFKHTFFKVDGSTGTIYIYYNATWNRWFLQNSGTNILYIEDIRTQGEWTTVKVGIEEISAGNYRAHLEVIGNAAGHLTKDFTHAGFDSSVLPYLELSSTTVADDMVVATTWDDLQSGATSTPPDITGSIDVICAPATASILGAVTPPTINGIINVTCDPATASIQGAVVSPAISGTIDAQCDPATASIQGAVTHPVDPPVDPPVASEFLQTLGNVLGAYLVGSVPFAGDSWNQSMPGAAESSPEVAGKANVLHAGASAVEGHPEVLAGMIRLRATQSLAEGEGESDGIGGRAIYAPPARIESAPDISGLGVLLSSGASDVVTDPDATARGLVLVDGIGLPVYFPVTEKQASIISFGNAAEPAKIGFRR